MLGVCLYRKRCNVTHHAVRRPMRSPTLGPVYSVDYMRKSTTRGQIHRRSRRTDHRITSRWHCRRLGMSSAEISLGMMSSEYIRWRSDPLSSSSSLFSFQSSPFKHRCRLVSAFTILFACRSFSPGDPALCHPFVTTSRPPTPSPPSPSKMRSTTALVLFAAAASVAPALAAPISL